jgi:hypothetical protein
MLQRILGMALAFLATACASPDGLFSVRLDAAAEPERRCAAWYAALDEATDGAGVRDAQYAPVAGFAYLRVDRLLASMRDRAVAERPAFEAWVERMRELDSESRRFEVDNLPRARIDTMPGMNRESGRELVVARTRECGALLAARDLSDAAARDALLKAAQVPDDYSTAKRVLGLYALTKMPFSNGVKRWEEETVVASRLVAALPDAPDAGRVRYAPPGSQAIARRTVAELFARARFDPLGQPLVSGRELDLIAAAYAPIFDVAIADDYDRFGALRWGRGGTLEVQGAQTAVYVLPAYTRYRDRILLQLVYMVWFPERPASGSLDMLAGRFDGVVWRVTLAPDGEPLLYDTIHPCGCYHEFFPTPRARRVPAPDEREEWAFVPQDLPAVREGERPKVRIASATHYVERVTLEQDVGLVRYEMRQYDELRSLQRLDGGRRGAFGADGLLAGSERLERFLFWPMGIDSAGAMRQWGRHATAFVGRRHFDDADLLEKRFELDLEPRRPQ